MGSPCCDCPFGLGFLPLPAECIAKQGEYGSQWRLPRQWLTSSSWSSLIWKSGRSAD